jgi:threonine dehydratase
MLLGLRQTRRCGAEYHGQGQTRRGDERQTNDAETADFQQSGQGGHRPRGAFVDVHAIIGDQMEAAREQPQHQIGFARAWWSDQQHTIAITAGAAPVDLHDVAIWADTWRKGSGLSPGRGRASVRAAMISRSDIAAAAARISGFVRHTPLLCLTGAELGLGFPVTLKLELLQHAGSFKPRGAFNRLLSAELPAAGVIAASGGNHGAAVAYAARALGATAEIFVPELTPGTKVARIASYGAHVVQIGATYAEALAASRHRQTETGALEVHAYDHPDVLAGQGTVGREFEHDAPDLTHILVATGGGGLIGGIAGWYAGSAAVISVEPEGCPALHDALQSGRPVEAPVGGLAADSLGARQVGGLMFPVAQAYVAGALLVSDAAIGAAQRLIWDRMRLIAEPGGATALAALLCGAFVPPAGARVGVLVCGANTDPGKVVEA